MPIQEEQTFAQQVKQAKTEAKADATSYKENGWKIPSLKYQENIEVQNYLS